MDPELIRQKQQFKQRALAQPVVEKKRKKEQGKDSVSAAAAAKPKKKKSKLARPKPKPLYTSANDSAEKIKQAAQNALRGNNQYRVLKAVVDMLRERHSRKEYDRLTLEEILTEVKLTSLRTDMRVLLNEALKDNAKVLYYPDGERFMFKPALGLGVKNRRQLLQLLQERDEQGLGGVLLSDVQEAVYKPDKAVKKLEDDREIIKLVRPDKEEVLFYRNHDYECPVDEDFKALWHRVSVDGVTEGDIEKYLQNVGLGAMQGESRKRKVPGQTKKPRKKSRPAKVLNTHLDSAVLKDYISEGASNT